MPALWVDFAPWGKPLTFDQPTQQRQAETADEVAPLLRWAEAQAKAGSWVAGYVGYEAAAAWGLPVVENTQTPLAWFGCYAPPQPACYPTQLKAPKVSLDLQINPHQHHADLQQILDYIQAGDSYQVNHTVRATPHFQENLHTLFLDRQTRYRFPYAIWLETSERTVASLSPELFLHRMGERVVTAPIKGTRPRGETLAQDQQLAHALRVSTKDAAEHIMIVDMARNDLGRVCQTGSIRVPHLKNCRSFATVHHLESRVEGTISKETDLAQLFAALFPAASITGAPKKRTMEIIKQLENRPRHIYTGSVGVIRPGGEAIFNVAIRTLEHQGEQTTLGLGGGVVADSNPQEEWQELADKAGFLTQHPTTQPPGLIETMKVSSEGGIPWLQEHLQRLENSATALGLPFNRVEADQQIQAELKQPKQHPYVLRLELKGSGVMTITTRACPTDKQALKLLVHPYPLDGQDPLLRHKTTRRQHFNTAYTQAQSQGYDDVLFLNTYGHLTECAIRAIFLQLQGTWYTPPIEDGLLPSLWREHTRHTLNAQIRSLTLEDLAHAQKIMVGNAVQGSQQVISWHIQDDPPQKKV
ncbi:chorismate-binding protein [Magnetococcus sp. PR-3]|uniref:chorismate-binding protein n=1 Tax=Magnetococcus sp. PR-3 TaxID=3120355 RepID=UPI002FCDEE24